MNTGWRKATASADNASCVKVRFDGSDVLLGDTKSAHLGDHEPTLRLPATQWAPTVAAVPNICATRPEAMA